MKNLNRWPLANTIKDIAGILKCGQAKTIKISPREARKIVNFYKKHAPNGRS